MNNTLKKTVMEILVTVVMTIIVISAIVTFINYAEMNEYVELVKNGEVGQRFEKATCVTSGVYVSKPFIVNGTKFIEVWDYNTTDTNWHYFRPIESR